MVLSRSPLCANIYVDFFPARADSVSILTHFHSDHMTNLRKHYPNKIYCSHITARLLQYRFQCEDVCAKPLDTVFCIGDDVKAVFVDANHCPGSVICIAMHNGGVYINTGDIRWYPELARRLLGHIENGTRIEQLHLDFSWAHEAFTSFPTKHESIQHVMEVLYDAPPEKSIWLHSHGLGDEELISAIISRFPSEYFYFVDRKRYGELQVLGGVLTSQCLLCNYGDRKELLALREKHRFFVVRNGRQRRGLPGLEISCSTLWWARQRHSNLKNASVIQDPRTRVWHVLWAMHSSLEELQDLVRDLRPKVLHPICGVILHEDSLTDPLDRFTHLLVSQSFTESPVPFSDGELAQIVPKDSTETLPVSLPQRVSLNAFFASCTTQTQSSTTMTIAPSYGVASENCNSASKSMRAPPHSVGVIARSSQRNADTNPHLRPHSATDELRGEQWLRKRNSTDESATSSDGQQTDYDNESALSDSEPVCDAKRRRLTASGTASVSTDALPKIRAAHSTESNIVMTAHSLIEEPRRVADVPNEPTCRSLPQDDPDVLHATQWAMSQCARESLAARTCSPARENHEMGPQSASQKTLVMRGSVWTRLKRDPIDLRDPESDPSCMADTSAYERACAADHVAAGEPALLVPGRKVSVPRDAAHACVKECGEGQNAFSGVSASTGSKVRARAEDSGVSLSRIRRDLIDLCDTDSNTTGTSDATPLARRSTRLLPTSSEPSCASTYALEKEKCLDEQARNVRAFAREHDSAAHETCPPATEGNDLELPTTPEVRSVAHSSIVERNWSSRCVANLTCLRVPPVRKAFSRALHDIEHVVTDTSSTPNSLPTDCPRLNSRFQVDRGRRKRRPKRPLFRTARASLFPYLFASQSSDSNSRSPTPVRDDREPAVTPCVGDSGESNQKSQATHVPTIPSNLEHGVVDVSSQNSEPRPPPLRNINHFFPICASLFLETHAPGPDARPLSQLRSFASTDEASPKASLTVPPLHLEPRCPFLCDIREVSATIDLSTQPPNVELDACAPLIPISTLPATCIRTSKCPLPNIRVSPHVSPRVSHAPMLSSPPTPASRSTPCVQSHSGIVSQTIEGISDVAVSICPHRHNGASYTRSSVIVCDGTAVHAVPMQQPWKEENAVIDSRPLCKRTRAIDLGCVPCEDDRPVVIDLQSDSQEIL